MAKNKKATEKKATIQTKHKADNSIEVTVTKAPSKTISGQILVWVIAALTLLLPVAGLIYMIIELGSK